MDNLSQNGVFNGPSKGMRSAGMVQDWPLNHGLYYNEAEKTFVCVNNRDQLHQTAKQDDADLHSAYFRYSKAMGEIKSQLQFEGHQFMYLDRLGYITTCHSDLGTGMRARVLIKLPTLCENMDHLDSLANAYNLQVRGTGGIDTPIINDVVDISKGERLGVSENQLIVNVSIKYQTFRKLETIFHIPCIWLECIACEAGMYCVQN